jgi:hypothetical protein
VTGTKETRAAASGAALVRAGRSNEIARKSKRFELRIEPSVLDRWRTFATAEEVAVAELIHASVEHFIARRSHLLSRR